MAQKFRKRPETIEAMQFTNKTKNQVYNWITCTAVPRFDDNNNPILIIKTLEGVMTARLGDWIIKDVNGDFHPCPPDIFEKAYKLVAD